MWLFGKVGNIKQNGGAREEETEKSLGLKPPSALVIEKWGGVWGGGEERPVGDIIEITPVLFFPVCGVQFGGRSHSAF